MNRRKGGIPLALSVAGLAVAVLGSTPLGEAAAERVVQVALYAKNADRVDGIEASRTPRPRRLLALDARGRFPASVVPPAAAGPVGPAGAAGPAGPPGPKGDTGAPGRPAARDWVAVAADGTLVRASDPATTVTKTGPGAYEVAFARAAGACAAAATLAAGPGAAGQIAVAAGSSERAILVETETSTGSNADRGFTLALLC